MTVRRLRWLIMIVAWAWIGWLLSDGVRGASVWPDRPIAVHVADVRDLDATRQAVRFWNAADVGRWFRIVSDSDTADIRVIRRSDCWSGGDHRRDRGTLACTNRVGYKQDAGPGEIRLLSDRASTPETIAHELGHVLGLRHVDDECSLMHRFGAISCPDYIDVRKGRGESRYEIRHLCGPNVQDVLSARRLFAHRGETAKPAWCVQDLG